MKSNDRINKIVGNNLYKECLMKNVELEKDRIFCKHNMEHFLDVARIAYIMVLESKLDIPKDIIYGAALLHDIGRFEQYQKGIPHENASAEIAVVILNECDYDETEIKIIEEAIINHGTNNEDSNILNNIIYESDKLSRACYSCGAYKECNWSTEKKNLKIRY